MSKSEPTILLVEDDKEMATFVVRLLKRQGYNTYAVHSVTKALEFVNRMTPDLFILDIELPDGDGIALCAELRKKTDAAVLFLTCRTDTRDKIQGLHTGGDYYLTKPYDKDELLAVIDSLLRRIELTKEKIAEVTVIEKGPLVLNIPESGVSINGEAVDLTPKEFAVLLLLVQNESKELSIDEIYKQVWKAEMYIDTGVVRKSISQIKKKLGLDDLDDIAILTRYGGGYTFINETDFFIGND